MKLHIESLCISYKGSRVVNSKIMYTLYIDFKFKGADRITGHVIDPDYFIVGEFRKQKVGHVKIETATLGYFKMIIVDSCNVKNGKKVKFNVKLNNKKKSNSSSSCSSSSSSHNYNPKKTCIICKNKCKPHSDNCDKPDNNSNHCDKPDNNSNHCDVPNQTCNNDKESCNDSCKNSCSSCNDSCSCSENNNQSTEQCPKPEPKPCPKPEPKPCPKPCPKPEPKPEPKTCPKPEQKQNKKSKKSSSSSSSSSASSSKYYIKVKHIKMKKNKNDK
jgi:hypothetical protein